jgi:plasmid stability protein
MRELTVAVDDEIAALLERRAATSGLSAEEEHRAILEAALRRTTVSDVPTPGEEDYQT